MNDSTPIPPVYRKPEYQQRQRQPQQQKKRRRDEEETQEEQEQLPRKGPPSLDGMTSIDLTA